MNGLEPLNTLIQRLEELGSQLQGEKERAGSQVERNELSRLLHEREALVQALHDLNQRVAAWMQSVDTRSVAGATSRAEREEDDAQDRSILGPAGGFPDDDPRWSGGKL